MGGLIAQKMGLPVSRLIISTNENNEVPEFLRTGIYNSISPSRNCISSAMNVGHPSNLARIVALYGGIMDEAGNILRSPDLKRMREDLFAVSVTDTETRMTIAEVYNQYQIMVEPHGAIALHGISEYFRYFNNLNSENQLCISLETAHPAKFPDELHKIINVDPPLPASLTGITGKTESYFSIENHYEKLKDFILKYY
jgi:threonine synthase